jgi:predicted nucleotidyltransferase
MTADTGTTPLATAIGFLGDAIADYCRRWQIVELAVFGSVLRDDFGPESDINVLVTFAPGARRTLLDLVRMERELAELLGREVDLIGRSSVEGSPYWIRRQAILTTAKTLYAGR